MPQRPSVLASVISITFVGVGRLPKNWIRTTFRVRRDAIRDGLNSLPLDDVPIEITSVIRQSEDMGIIEQESEGYIPLDDDEGESCG